MYRKNKDLTQHHGGFQHSSSPVPQLKSPICPHGHICIGMIAYMFCPMGQTEQLGFVEKVFSIIDGRPSPAPLL